MRKFKHITGLVAIKQQGELYKVKTNKQYSNFESIIESCLIEDSSEWEEIIEKEYEILSFRIIKGVFMSDNERIIYSPFPGYTEKDYIGNNKVWDIHSIKRVSDGEIFTIGDKAKFLTGNSQEIKSFQLRGNEIKVNLEFNSYLLQSIVKVKEKPLFITFDKIKVFEGQLFHCIDSKKFTINPRNGGDGLNFKSKEVLSRCYSFEANAKEWILMNKPCLSINDVLKVYEYEIKLKDELKELVKSKL